MKHPDMLESKPIGLGAIPDRLLVSAGDAEQRETYFDHDDDHLPIVMKGRAVHIVLGERVNLPDYRDRDNRHVHRVFLIVPPKLRENIRGCFGVETNSDYPITKSIVALADYGAMVLKRDGKRLHVEQANDDFEKDRKAARKKIRVAAAERKGR